MNIVLVSGYFNILSTRMLAMLQATSASRHLEPVTYSPRPNKFASSGRGRKVLCISVVVTLWCERAVAVTPRAITVLAGSDEIWPHCRTDFANTNSVGREKNMCGVAKPLDVPRVLSR